jgi:hypothetical protein
MTMVGNLELRGESGHVRRVSFEKALKALMLENSRGFRSYSEGGYPAFSPSILSSLNPSILTHLRIRTPPDRTALTFTFPVLRTLLVEGPTTASELLMLTCPDLRFLAIIGPFNHHHSDCGDLGFLRCYPKLERSRQMQLSSARNIPSYTMD